MSDFTLFDPGLALCADYLDDVENLRKANAARYRTLITADPDEDGVVRGYGLPMTHPSVIGTRDQLDKLEKLEADAVKTLERNMRNHPLGPWVKRQLGIGEKTVARLLGKIGDPYINAATGEPRTVFQLWAYCGLHVTGDGSAPRRKKGVQANWNTDAKTRSWLCVTSACPKILRGACKDEDHVLDLPGTVRWHEPNCECSKYRVIMDNRRARTAQTHPDWTPGHSQRDAERVASKRFLADLWEESKRLHEAAALADAA